MEFGPVALAPYPYLVATYIYIYRISVFSCYARNSEEGSYCPPREESAGQAESELMFLGSPILVDLKPNRIFKDFSNFDV